MSDTTLNINDAKLKDAHGLLMDYKFSEAMEIATTIDYSETKIDAIFDFLFALRNLLGLTDKYNSIIELLKGNVRFDFYDIENNISHLHLALFENLPEFIDIIIENSDPDLDIINIQTSSGYTALHIAVQHGYIEQVHRLLKYDVDLDKYNSEGLTILHMAIIYNNIELVRILIDNGADKYVPFRPSVDSIMYRELIDPTNLYCSYPPLHLAVAYDNYDIITILIDSGIDINFTNECEETALLVSYKFGHYNIATTLIEYGAELRLLRDTTVPDMSDYDFKARYCAPKRSHFKYSCYTKKELIEIAKTWNKCQKDPTKRVSIRQNLPNLINSLRREIGTGTNDWCMVNHPCFNMDFKLKNKNYDIFRPTSHYGVHGVSGLRDGDIYSVLSQYKDAYPNLEFLQIMLNRDKDSYIKQLSGYPDDQLIITTSMNKPYPLDIDSELETLFSTYEKIAILITIESHASSLFIDMTNSEIDYFNSAGKLTQKEAKVKEAIDTIMRLSNLYDIQYVQTIMQNYGGDCGVYSLYHLVERIKGVPFSELISKSLRPEEIYRYRRYFWKPKCPKNPISHSDFDSDSDFET